MAENKSQTVKISTTFVTTGKRPVIVVRSGNRKAQYPAVQSTTKSHEAAVHKFVTKVYGKGAKDAALVRTLDGPTGDRYDVTVPNVGESTAPESD